MIAFGTILYNEEKLIRGLITNISRYCDELVVVDQESTDKTIEIVKKACGDEPSLIIANVKNKKYCEPHRTLLLSLPQKYDWMFVIDADERLPDNIPIDELTAKGYDAISFPMRSLYFEEGSGYEEWFYDELREKGKEIDEHYPDYHCRLLKKDTVWPAEIHETPSFNKEYNASDYDMLHIKTYEGQLAKVRKYNELFPGQTIYYNAYLKHIQKQLGKKITTL